MKRLTGLIVVGLVLGAMAAPVGAAPKPKLPKITGGGQATNNNSGHPVFPMQVTQFGFNAQATGPGVSTPHPPWLLQPSVVYPAKGQFQGRNYDPATNSTVNQGHGEVVCLANYGPAGTIDGGGDPAGTVWEIRVRFEDPSVAPVPFYGSALVQDNGQVDYMDESFANLFNPACGNVVFFELEPVTQGNIQAH